MHRAQVSIIIPTFNRPELLRRALLSCFAQSYAEIEIIVVDDASSDRTARQIADLQQEHPVSLRYVPRPGEGAGAARNAGLDLAEGEFIQFLDDDDLLSPDKLDIQVRALRESPHPAAVSDVRVASGPPGGSVLRTIGNSDDLQRKLASFRSIFHTSALMRADSLLPGCRYNPDLPCFQDIDFMFRYFLTVTGWVHTPGELCTYVTHPGTRISDRYTRKFLRVRAFPHERLLESALTYWRGNRTLIPAANEWMIGEYLTALARQCSSRGGQLLALGSLARSLTLPRRPGGYGRMLFTAGLGLARLLTLNIERHLHWRHWERARTPDERELSDAAGPPA